MDWTSWKPILEKELREFMKSAPSISSSHDVDHVERVWDRCFELGSQLNADLEVLIAAAYFHDLGRHHGLNIHGEKSAELAGPILERIDYPIEKTGKVLEAIKLHDYQTAPSERTLLEAQILYDADKLDAFGESGLKRWPNCMKKFNYSNSDVIHQIEERYRTLHLEKSKKLAKEDYKLVIEHFKGLD